MSHTTTGEWKSFEVRMRHRRAERLLARADAAVDAGRPEEARVCLAEARRVAPNAPGIALVEHKLASPAARRGVSPRVWPGAAAMFAVLALGGWLLRPHAPLPSHDFRAVGLAAPAPSLALLAPPAPPRVAQPDTTVLPTSGRMATADVALPIAEPHLATIGVETPVLRDPPTLVREAPSARIAPIPVDGDVAAVAALVEALPPPSTPPPAPAASPAAAAPSPTAPASTGPASGPSATAPPVSAPPVSAPPAAAPRADAGVRSALDRYAAAYSSLDADAAGRVWPQVNRAALRRAFDSLASQQISLGQCRIDISGAAARASCAGTATWAPKVGGGGERTEDRRWTFELTRAGAEWQIVNARVQNR